MKIILYEWSLLNIKLIVRVKLKNIGHFELIFYFAL